MNLTPLGDRVIVELDDIEEKTESGLIIPDQALTAPGTGTIAAKGLTVGDTLLYYLEVGDRVTFMPRAGLPLDGYPNHRLFATAELLTVIKDN